MEEPRAVNENMEEIGLDRRVDEAGAADEGS